MINLHPTASWFDNFCKCCGYNVVISQASEGYDYYWYCSNKFCENHIGVETGDDEWPSWVTSRKEALLASRA